MSYEKQNGIPKRRPLPTSSTSTQSPKLFGRGPSLPKLAGSPVTTTLSSHRKDSWIEASGTEDGYSDEAFAPPVKTFLSSNITPRSGARKVRAETASPSPHNTPNVTPSTSKLVSPKEYRKTPTEDTRARSGLGLRISNTGKRSRAGSVISDAPGSSVSSQPVSLERDNLATRVASPENTPKFFHANDVRPNLPSNPSSEEVPPRLAGYPQASQEKISLSSGRGLSTDNSPTSEVQSPKFFYANDSKESRPFPSKLANGNASNRPPLHTIYSAHTVDTPSRAPSPLKDEVLPRKPSITKASPRRHTRLVSNGGSEIKQPDLINSGNGDLSRRSSVTSNRPPPATSHRRSSSVQSAGPSPPRISSTVLSQASPTERTRTTSLVGANGDLAHSVNPPTITQELPHSLLPQPPRSPTKVIGASQSKIDQMNEMAANARRERKVLDLEISNSSLLAINRTLEREMRKQTAELRRYRRLSRSGRMSIAPSRYAQGDCSLRSETDTNIDSDDVFSASEEGNDTEDLPSNCSSTSTKSRPSSSARLAARARFQDPVRIQLDFDAHRTLLLDGQKLNFSITRCLSLSEALLSSGKRALEYRTPSPELESLGARVLTPDDNEDEGFARGQGLLSPSINSGGANPWERSLGSIGSLDEGLSTPDYSRWGPSTAPRTPFAECGEHPWMVDPGDEIGVEHDEEPIHEATMEENEPEIEESESAVTEDTTDVRPLPPPKDASTNQSMLKPKPDPLGRRVSDISIDGVDESFDSDASTDEDRTLQSFTERARTPEGRSIIQRKQIPQPPDPSPGDAGYRGSMQGLGHYLQAFSIFGTKQKA